MRIKLYVGTVEEAKKECLPIALDHHLFWYSFDWQILVACHGGIDLRIEDRSIDSGHLRCRPTGRPEGCRTLQVVSEKERTWWNYNVMKLWRGVVCDCLCWVGWSRRNCVQPTPNWFLACFSRDCMKESQKFRWKTEAKISPKAFLVPKSEFLYVTPIHVLVQAHTYRGSCFPYILMVIETKWLLNESWLRPAFPPPIRLLRAAFFFYL